MILLIPYIKESIAHEGFCGVVRNNFAKMIHYSAKIPKFAARFTN